MEGTPVQELCAIQVDTNTNAIIDVFHEYGNFCAQDFYARQHVHGLDKLFLRWNSVGSESELLELFLSWLKLKSYKAIYANNPAKEANVLGLPILNFPLPNWVERQHKSFHRTAVSLKNHCKPIFMYVCCPLDAHCSFLYPADHVNPERRLAKVEHGYHCALYDAYELYLAYCSGYA